MSTWTRAERDLLRSRYATTPAAELAGALGRSAFSVYQAARVMGLRKSTRCQGGKTFLAEIQRLNGMGLSDTDAAVALGCERHTVSRWRTRLGLPSHARGLCYRAKVRAGTDRQCESLGVRSLAEVRSLVFALQAINAGWPPECRPREVQILEALSARGPMTRREIADAIGMPWKGSRHSLTGNVPGGSYLAHLIALGLVTSLGRVGTVHGAGRGRSVQVYSLSLDAMSRS